MPGKGFAALSEDERKQISSMGGRAAQAVGTAHKWTSEEARAAGRKGGAAVHAKRKEEARLRGHVKPSAEERTASLLDLVDKDE
jgi:hypothetical protein